MRAYCEILGDIGVMVSIQGGETTFLRASCGSQWGSRPPGRGRRPPDGIPPVNYNLSEVDFFSG